jgi:xanthine dehydrogenase YagT iron-sulfur-binding subunit
MADSEKVAPPVSTAQADADASASPAAQGLTRRDFLIRSNAGAVAVGVMAGTNFALASPPAEQSEVAQAPDGRPLAVKRVMLNIDGRPYDVTVDVRESLWETLNNRLGMANANLGCDRAQCGACTVLVDGRPVNGCTVLTARLGRGQKIVTVAGIAPGPGIDGLHPVQRAFWLEGGFQCGICTRGFVMSTYALLQTTTSPSDEDIHEALGGNICRCGEYPKILGAVQKAAAEMRGEQVTYAAPLLRADQPEAATAAATERASKQFQFVAALGTIEVFEELAVELRQVPGILGVSGTERTITPVWDPARLDEARVRQLLADAGHPVRP